MSSRACVEMRTAFLTERDALSLAPLLNHGAPRKADLEFDRDLPPLVREYLEYMLAHTRERRYSSSPGCIARCQCSTSSIPTRNFCIWYATHGR